MSNVPDIIKKAKRVALKLEKLKLDKRYKDVMGRLIHEGLIEAKGLKENAYKLFLEDMLWVGEKIEPRVLEVLPAILIKKPSVVHKSETPEDLHEVLIKLSKNEISGEFRGIPLKSCHQWIKKIGRKGRLPSVTKTFRFKFEDVEILKKLKQKKKISETEIIREALKFYSAS